MGPVTQHLVDHAPITDVLFRNAKLAHVIELPVLGIATRFETNSAYVGDVIEEAFGDWRNIGDFAEPSAGVRVRLIVHEGTEHVVGHAPIRHLCPDDTRIIVQSPGSVAISDPLRRESVAYVTSELAADRAHFRDAVLEAITLALLCAFDRHPLHASAVAAGGRALLLAAPSGTGKSTLAYAAHRAGLSVLSEDRVWIQLEPDVRVWGWPGQVRLLPSDAARVPEPSHQRAQSTANGKAKVIVDVPTESRYVAGLPAVCILERGAGKVALRRLPPDELIDALDRDLSAGFDRFANRHARVLQAVTSAGGWQLTLSHDADAAVPLLMQVLGDV